MGGIFMSKRIKYSYEFKLRVVKYYLKTNKGYLATAKHFNIQGSVAVLFWVSRYKEHGKEGLKNIKTCNYDGKFKQTVIEYMHQHHLSYSDTASIFNIGSHNIIGRWDEIYYAKGPQGLYKRKDRAKCRKPINMSKKPKRSSKEEELIAENLRLKMENEYLKKLNALVQERIKRENKKK